MVYLNELEHLDEIAREAFAGNYRRTGVLSTGELLYVALASGRMRELCPGDSIAYAVERVGPEWMAHMQQVWRSDRQPEAAQPVAPKLTPPNCQQPIDKTLVELAREVESLRGHSDDASNARRNELNAYLYVIGATAAFFGGYSAMKRLHDAAEAHVGSTNEVGDVLNRKWDMIGGWMA